MPGRTANNPSVKSTPTPKRRTAICPAVKPPFVLIRVSAAMSPKLTPDAKIRTRAPARWIIASLSLRARRNMAEKKPGVRIELNAGLNHRGSARVTESRISTNASHRLVEPGAAQSLR